MRCINADELLSWFDNHYDDEIVTVGYVSGLIKDSPTVEPERKTGKWIPDNNNYYEERYICSACKRSYKVDTCMGKPIWNYCPNCGDKKEEGKQE